MKKVRLDNIFKSQRFNNVPVQVHKCHLHNIILPSDQKSIERAKQFVIDTILGKNCSIYINHTDLLHPDSISCTIRSLDKQLDVASLLISHGLVDIASNFKRPDKICETKRIRNDCDDAVLKNSDELHNVDDVRLFYETKKIVLPVDIKVHQDYENERNFEVFDLPLQRCPLVDKNSNISRHLNVTFESNPMIESITQHFKLPDMTERMFYCQPVYIVNPVTILVMPDDAKVPHIEAMEQKYNQLLPGIYSSSLANGCFYAGEMLLYEWLIAWNILQYEKINQFLSWRFISNQCEEVNWFF